MLTPFYYILITLKILSHIISHFSCFSFLPGALSFHLAVFPSARRTSLSVSVEQMCWWQILLVFCNLQLLLFVCTLEEYLHWIQYSQGVTVIFFTSKLKIPLFHHCPGKKDDFTGTELSTDRALLQRSHGTIPLSPGVWHYRREVSCQSEGYALVMQHLFPMSLWEMVSFFGFLMLCVKGISFRGWFVFLKILFIYF